MGKGTERARGRWREEGERGRGEREGARRGQGVRGMGKEEKEKNSLNVRVGGRDRTRNVNGKIERNEKLRPFFGANLIISIIGSN